MATAIDKLATYLHLAQMAKKRLQMPDRDRYLVLAAESSSELQLPRIAWLCRHLILNNNPGHMVRRWPDIDTALQHEDFQFFVKQIRRRFPPERAESILQQWGISLANERQTYYSDEEYAAAILGVDMEWLAGNFPD